ncbi:hypothetical protein LPJ73_001946 [Coemansia sp. RSA 2703]|nr:hypothetical protein LPJ73_001946 [Coemansia sp. RSA 2703]KAJ2366731.1 hypothetical protein IW150_005863 [Coemansia sp. RSA 2607]KAJ2387287.1 hypothetical protein GGI05_004132 [Coemansia sp. RSA 2603]
MSQRNENGAVPPEQRESEPWKKDLKKRLISRIALAVLTLCSIIPPISFAATMFVWQKQNTVNKAHTGAFYVKQDCARAFVIVGCLGNLLRVYLDYRRLTHSSVRFLFRRITRMLTWACLCVVAFNDRLLDYSFAESGEDKANDNEKSYYSTFLYAALGAQAAGIVLYFFMGWHEKLNEKNWKDGKEAMAWKNKDKRLPKFGKTSA